MRYVLFFSYHFYTYVSLEREAECVGYRDFSTINVLGSRRVRRGEIYLLASASCVIVSGDRSHCWAQ